MDYMNGFQPSFRSRRGETNPASLDARLQPTPDYGTLGPSSDVGPGGLDSNSLSRTTRPPRFAAVLASMLGALLAGLVGALTHSDMSWPSRKTALPSADHAASPLPSAIDTRQLDRLRPQKQAEALLELAVGHSEGAVDQISSRVDGWDGKLKWTPQIATLTTAALNSHDRRVRESGVEVELAAYGLSKNSASLEYLLRTTDSPNHAQKIWALWALGLMGNRGVQTDRVLAALTQHVKDSDADSRHWAIEGLALVGTPDTIDLLLKTMHDDPSPLVRETAACGLAASGMLTHKQRLSVVPQLLSYTDDPALDAQTRGWAFQALGEITGQRLPDDSAAWRNWYNSTENN